MNDATKPPEHYDLESVYDNEIAPLMTQILAICKRERMPMMASFQYRDDDDGAALCTSHLQWPERSSDCFREAVRVFRRPLSIMAMTITTDGGTR